MRQRKIVRLRSFDYRGECRCAFTICVHERRRVFTSADIVGPAISQISQCASAEKIAVAAYCFMPDHLHLLTIGRQPDSDTMRFISLTKQKTAFEYVRQHRKRLWQRYAWDRVLRSDEDTLTVVRYILDNPVRARLVDNAWDYPFSGSLVWTRDELTEMLWAGTRAG